MVALRLLPLVVVGLSACQLAVKTEKPEPIVAPVHVARASSEPVPVASVGKAPPPVASPVPASSAPAASPVPPLSAAETAAIEKLMTAKIDPAGPGAVLTVARNSQVLFQKGYGLADVAAGTPLDAHTVFDLASCSKQFTGMAVLRLVAAGQLSLDDDVRTYLPELPAYDPTRPIRVGDMLHMVSGLPIYTDFLDDVTGVDNQALVAKVGARKLGFATGTRWKYNNSDYALAASIVQRVAKEPFARFMQAQIFGPLGMAHSLVLDTPGANVPGRAQGYTPKKGGGFRAVREDTAIVGDGQVFSSAEDLLRWDRALREHTLVGPELAALAEASGKLDSGKQTGYGFGWFPYRDRGHVLVNHEGEWTGTNTYISRNLEDGTCVIVLANNDALGAGDLGTAVEQALGSP